MRTRSYFSLSLVCLALACATSTNQAGNGSAAGSGNAIVIKGTDVNGGVLQALRSRIPSMRVVTIASSRCPRIIFRAEKSIYNQGDPTIYIDGTRMYDTCALQEVGANEIDRIEVYVSGITPYPQIERNPFGLILIFRRQE